MTHINGNGYASSHKWQDRGTPYSGCTNYKCTACGATFSHFYHSTSSIFKALEQSGVPDKCPQGASDDQ